MTGVQQHQQGAPNKARQGEDQMGTDNLAMSLTLVAIFVPALVSAKPNIIFVLMDDVGHRDLGYTDPTFYTPTIDRLRSEGIRMSQTYTPPNCGPSRSALFSGGYSFRFGLQKEDANNTTPFFILLSHQAIHVPNQVPQKYVDDHCQGVSDLERKIKCGMLAAVDEGLKNILDELNTAGFLDNTLIVFTSDNGGGQTSGSSNFPLRGGKGTLWEGGIRGSPTSFRGEFAYINEGKNRSYIRKGDWKLLLGENAETGWYMPPDNVTADPEPKKSDIPYIQLFNVTADPNEKQNKADDFPSVVTELKKALNDSYWSIWQPEKVKGQYKSDPFGIACANGVMSPGYCPEPE
nr:hypothetical protein BaRGS_023332 [Batillaria attramentaria]